MVVLQLLFCPPPVKHSLLQFSSYFLCQVRGEFVPDVTGNLALLCIVSPRSKGCFGAFLEKKNNSQVPCRGLGREAPVPPAVLASIFRLRASERASLRALPGLTLHNTLYAFSCSRCDAANILNAYTPWLPTAALP